MSMGKWYPVTNVAAFTHGHLKHMIQHPYKFTLKISLAVCLVLLQQHSNISKWSSLEDGLKSTFSPWPRVSMIKQLHNTTMWDSQIEGTSEWRCCLFSGSLLGWTISEDKLYIKSCENN